MFSQSPGTGDYWYLTTHYESIDIGSPLAWTRWTDTRRATGRADAHPLPPPADSKQREHSLLTSGKICEIIELKFYESQIEIRAAFLFTTRTFGAERIAVFSPASTSIDRQIILHMLNTCALLFGFGAHYQLHIVANARHWPGIGLRLPALHGFDALGVEQSIRPATCRAAICSPWLRNLEKLDYSEFKMVLHGKSRGKLAN